MSVLLTGDRSGLGLISVYSHALFFNLCTRAVVLLLLETRKHARMKKTGLSIKKQYSRLH